MRWRGFAGDRNIAASRSAARGRLGRRIACPTRLVRVPADAGEDAGQGTAVEVVLLGRGANVEELGPGADGEVTGADFHRGLGIEKLKPVREGEAAGVDLEVQVAAGVFVQAQSESR